MWIYHTGRFTFSTWHKLKYKEAAWGHIGRICQSHDRRYQQDRKVIMVCTRNDCKIGVVFIQTWMEPLVLQWLTTFMRLTQHVGESRREMKRWNRMKQTFNGAQRAVPKFISLTDGLIRSQSRDRLQFNKVTWPESDHVCVMWLSDVSCDLQFSAHCSCGGFKTTCVSWEP